LSQVEQTQQQNIVATLVRSTRRTLECFLSSKLYKAVIMLAKGKALKVTA
jgi:hypothetical protein